MKKLLLILGGVVLILIVGVYIGAVYFLGNIVQAGVHKFGPQLTGTKVELASAQLSPLTGVGTLSGFTVGNPPGWSDHNAFSLGKAHLDMEPKSLFGDVVVVNELVIDQPEFLYETKLVSSNLKDILKNIEAYAGKGGEQPTAKDGKPKKFIIRKLQFTNGKATVGIAATALPVPLPEINLQDLGVAEGGLTINQIAVRVSTDVVATIVRATAGAFGQLGGAAGANSLEQAKEAAKGLEDSVRGLFKKEEKK